MSRVGEAGGENAVLAGQDTSTKLIEMQSIVTCKGITLEKRGGGIFIRTLQRHKNHDPNLFCFLSTLVKAKGNVFHISTDQGTPDGECQDIRLRANKAFI